MKLSRLLNTEGADPALRQKMNVTYGLLSFGSAMGIVFFFLAWGSHQPTVEAVMALMVTLMTGCMIWLRQTRRTGAAIWGFSLSVVLVEPWLVNNNVLNGGMAACLFPGIPLFYLMGGLRVGTAWTLSSLVVFLGMLNLQLHGSLHMPMSPTFFTGYIIFFVETGVFVFIYAREKERLSEILERQKAGVEHEVQVRTHQYQEEQAKLAASIESLRTGFIILDHNMQLLSINEAGRHILAQPDSPNADQKSPALHTLHDILERFRSNYDLVGAVKDCMQRKAPVAAQNVPFGTRFLAVTITPVIDHQDVIGTVVLVEDITDRKALERSRDEFFSIASHELRTPLTAIMGNASMGLQYYDKMNEADRKELLGEINTSGKRLITIVNDFLDTSRLEQGNMKFNLQAVDARQVAGHVIKDFEASGSAQGLELRIAPSGQDPFMVQADPDRLKQILVNLVGNAIKYTDEGKVTIELLRDGKRARIVVTDTGSGIPVESQHLLFRKFQQASNNILTRDNTQSTGLGLYISKLMAEGMHSKLSLKETAVGKGSAFMLEVPLAKEAPLTKAVPAKA